MGTMPWISDPGFNPGNSSSGSNQFFPSMPQMPSPGNFGNVGNVNNSNSPAPFTNPDVGTFGNFTGTNFSVPGTAPNQTASPTGGSSPLTLTGPQGASGMTGIGKGLFAQNPLDPALTSQLFQWLQSQIGQGVPGFNLSTLLPSSGQSTAPGTLNAPLNDVMKNIMAMFDPSSGSLGKLASGGIDATPIWQKTIDAMQRQTDQGAANMREQFSFAGNLDSSPFGQSMTDYFSQDAKNKDAMLGNMQFQGIQDQLAAAGQMGGVGQFLQGLDQQSIQNMLQEFIRTSPQYNPLLGMEMGAATTFPPVLNPKSGAGGIGALLGGAGGAASGIADLATLFL